MAVFVSVFNGKWRSFLLLLSDRRRHTHRDGGGDDAYLCIMHRLHIVQGALLKNHLQQLLLMPLKFLLTDHFVESNT